MISGLEGIGEGIATEISKILSFFSDFSSFFDD